MTHPVFSKVDENSFKELASIADAWLGWSYAESDTESETSTSETSSIEKITTPQTRISSLLVPEKEARAHSAPPSLKNSNEGTKGGMKRSNEGSRLTRSSGEGHFRVSSSSTEEDSETSRESPILENQTSVSRANSLQDPTTISRGSTGESKKSSDKIKTLPRSRGSDPNLKKSKDQKRKGSSSERSSPSKTPSKRNLKKSDDAHVIPEENETSPTQPQTQAQPQPQTQAQPTSKDDTDISVVRRTSFSFLPVG